MTDVPKSPEAVPKSPKAVPLTRAESLQLLADVPVGRIAFSHRALPAIRPVSHILDDDFVVFGTHRDAGPPGASAFTGVVAFETDQIDPLTRTGWSVVVTGTATPVLDAGQLARYRGLLVPWLGSDLDEVGRISTEMVTGIRLTAR